MAVGWSSDVLPFAKRMSNVAIVVPKSGASLWADLWVLPLNLSILLLIYFAGNTFSLASLSVKLRVGVSLLELKQEE